MAPAAVPANTFASSACWTPAPPGVKGTSAATALTPSTSSTLRTEPPTLNASSSIQNAVKRKPQPRELDEEHLAQVAAAVEEIVRPWRTRAQNARTRADSSAKRDQHRDPSTVSTNSVKRGCEAKNARSKAGSLEKSGGLGKTPWVNAKRQHGDRDQRSKMSSTEKRAATAG